MSFNKDLLEILVCPLTKQPLEYDFQNQELISKSGGICFPIKQGIPIMLIDEVRIFDRDRAEQAGFFLANQYDNN